MNVKVLRYTCRMRMRICAVPPVLATIGYCAGKKKLSKNYFKLVIIVTLFKCLLLLWICDQLILKLVRSLVLSAMLCI